LCSKLRLEATSPLPHGEQPGLRFFVHDDSPAPSREISATQQLNTRAISDRTYHLLVSLRAGENPDAQTLRVIEERFCKELGYAEHQRVSVVHHDTDNVHIHVAINKIHPRTLTLHNPATIIKPGPNFARFLSTS
jgi:Relaxase/Mobilisation nuclease domain